MPRIVLYVQPGFQVPGRDRYFSGTPFAIKVARLLRYKRLDFEVDEIGWTVRANRLPELSVSGKLPVLEYEGRRIEDSTEMAYFLEGKQPVPNVIPADPLLRARCHFIEEWSDEVLHRYGSYEQRRMTGSDAVTAFIEADGFVAGRELSLADLALIGQFDRRMSGTNPWMESEILSRAPMVDWLARVDGLSRL